MMSPLRHVLFDLDGTLVDTSALHAHAFQRALAELAPALLDGFCYEQLSGRPTREVLERLGVQGEPALRTLTDAKRAHFSALMQQAPAHQLCFEGARSLCRHLARRGVGVFVVTSAARRSAESSLHQAGLRPLIRALITADDVPRGKPSPLPYQTALDRFGLRAPEVLVVEDAASGIASARAARLSVVRVHGAQGSLGEDRWFPDLLALGAVLRRSALPHAITNVTMAR